MMELARRWFVFYIVGALGFIVQLAALLLLVRCFGWGVMAATAVAVEVAVVHNFLWHACWTWADRPARDLREACRRLLEFNLANGVVSLAGNLLLMRVFLEILPVNYLVANLFAVIVCSILTFLIGDQLVFRGRSRSGSLIAGTPLPSSVDGPAVEEP